MDTTNKIYSSKTNETGGGGGGSMSLTMTTTELVEEVSKIEVFDADFARELRANPDVPKEERDKLRRYLKRCENIHHVKVDYKLGKSMRSQHLNLGRLCATDGVGLQCFSRDVRSALAGRYYWDVDVVNAQPTLIVQYCEREGWECGALKRYVETREEVLEDMERDLGIQRWEAKERIISILFGASAEGLTPFLTRDLQPEVRRILTNVWAKNADTLKWLKSQPNHMGRGMAFLFQTEERKVLLAMDKAFGKRGRSLDVLIHDGGLVRKREGETELPRSLLREVEADVKAETGYSVRLAVKSLETTIEREGDDQHEYAERKRAWEMEGWKGLTFFKLRSPPCFIGLGKDTMEQYSRQDLLQNEENNILADGTPFVKKWLTDPEMKEYNKVDFFPKQDAPAGCYNLWKGFAMEPVAGNHEPFQRVLWYISGKDKKVFDYVENWLALIIQKPWMKTLVALIFYGEEGVGKDTFWDAIGVILGREHFYNTKDPENNVFAKFNSAVARKILIKFEEANFQTNKENADKLKSIITCKEDNIEKKGKDVITLNSYTNVVMTTNRDIPVVLSETDRRYVLIQSSSDVRNNAEFWYPLVNHEDGLLRNPAVLSAYHHYLLHKDISNFSPQRDRPITDFYRDVKQTFLPYHTRFFQRQLELDPEREETLEWTSHALFRAMKESAPAELKLNETRFGRDMRVYVDAGVILKTKGRMGNVYTCSPTRLREWMVARDWWVNY